MFDAYKVAVKLTLVNHVSTGLAAIASQLGHVNSRFGEAQAGAAALERKLLDIKRMGLIGGALAGAGFGGLALFKAPLEEAKKFQTEVAKFSSLGFGTAITKEATEFARGMKTIGTSATENMSLVSDAMAVFKDLHHAQMAAPLMAKMKFANQAVFGAEKGGANESKFMDMLKVIEFRGGLSSQKEFETQADYVQKVISGSRNRVDATQLLSALKTGGVALSRRSNEQFYLGGEPLIQEFGGQRYGTGAMSIYQNLVQARGTITAQQELYRLGLLDKSMVEFNQLGKLKKARPGAFVGSKVLEEEGELALLEKVLLPAFAAKGITGDENIVRELGMILGNRTGSGLMSRIYQQRATIKMQSEANRNAMGIDALHKEGQGTLAGKEIDLHAKWRDALRELGTTVLPLAIKAVTGMTSALKGFTDFAKDHPTLIKTLSIAFVGLSGAMAFGGTVLLLKTGFKGLGVALELLGAPGGAIGTATKAVGLFGKALGVLGAVAAAWAAGQFAGGVINDHLSDKTKDTIGRTIAKTLAFFGNREAQEALDAERRSQTRSVVPPPSNQPVQVHTQVNMDGFKVANIVSKHQAKSMARPQVGPSGFDGSMNLRALGSGFAG